MTCLFCNSSTLKLLFSGSYHPFAKWHGPFNFYRCNNCGSGITWPVPTNEQLRKLYQSFSGGMIPGIREIREEYPLHVWFRQCFRHAFKYYNKNAEEINEISWIDIGAGNGEMAVTLERELQGAEGIAIDFHDRPLLLERYSSVKWISADLNDVELDKINGMSKADMIFFITVFEHLRSPHQIIEQALSLLKEDSCFYMTTPRLDCLAFSVLQKKWPYFIPGEHLHIPSVTGMKILLERICKTLFPPGSYNIYVKPVKLPYPAGYYAKYFGMKKLARIMPADWVLKLPTGLLEAAVTLKMAKHQY